MIALNSDHKFVPGEEVYMSEEPGGPELAKLSLRQLAGEEDKYLLNTMGKTSKQEGVDSRGAGGLLIIASVLGAVGVIIGIAGLIGWLFG